MTNLFSLKAFLKYLLAPVGIFLGYVVLSTIMLLLVGREYVLEVTVLFDILAIVAAGVYVVKTHSGFIGRVKSDGKLAAAVLVGLAVACVVIWITGQCLATSIYAMQGDSNFDTYTSNLNLNPTLALILSLIIAPIAEEILYRGLLFGCFSKGTGSPVLSAIVTSGIFALMHGTVVHVPFTFGLGMLCCALYAYTGRIIVPILVHIVCNLGANFITNAALPQIFFDMSFSGAIWVVAIIGLMFVLRLAKSEPTLNKYDSFEEAMLVEGSELENTVIPLDKLEESPLEIIDVECYSSNDSESAPAPDLD